MPGQISHLKVVRWWKYELNECITILASGTSIQGGGVEFDLWAKISHLEVVRWWKYGLNECITIFAEGNININSQFLNVKIMPIVFRVWIVYKFKIMTHYYRDWLVGVIVKYYLLINDVYIHDESGGFSTWNVTFP